MLDILTSEKYKKIDIANICPNIFFQGLSCTKSSITCGISYTGGGPLSTHFYLGKSVYLRVPRVLKGTPRYFRLKFQVLSLQMISI